MGLGSTEFVSLAQARERAFELRRQLKDRGVDPLERRRAAGPGSGSPRLIVAPSRRWQSIRRGTVGAVEGRRVPPRMAFDVERYAFPIIGSFSVASIDTALVHRVLDPVWTKKTHVGQRLRERIEAVLEFAKSVSLREGENPARWKGHLANMLPKAARTSRTQHHAALPYNEMPALMAEIRALPGIAARRRVHGFTAARTGEARFARWCRVRSCSAHLGDPRRAHEGRQGASSAAGGSGADDLARASARRRCGVRRA